MQPRMISAQKERRAELCDAALEMHQEKKKRQGNNAADGHGKGDGMVMADGFDNGVLG